MSDQLLNPEVARTAALARVIRAKSEFSKVCVDYLRGEYDAAQVSAAVAEVDAARKALRDMDAREDD